MKLINNVKRSVGRPRSEELKTDIYGSTLELLKTQGFTSLTIVDNIRQQMEVIAEVLNK